MGLGDRQQQFEARLALTGFQPGQGALGDTGRGGQLGQGDAPPDSYSLEAGADFGQDGRNRRRDCHSSSEIGVRSSSFHPPAPVSAFVPLS
jgi:hypothetical protein